MVRVAGPGTNLVAELAMIQVTGRAGQLLRTGMRRVLGGNTRRQPQEGAAANPPDQSQEFREVKFHRDGNRLDGVGYSTGRIPPCGPGCITSAANLATDLAEFLPEGGTPPNIFMIGADGRFGLGTDHRGMNRRFDSSLVLPSGHPGNRPCVRQLSHLSLRLCVSAVNLSGAECTHGAGAAVACVRLPG
jgi:hypothetical protein